MRPWTTAVRADDICEHVNRATPWRWKRDATRFRGAAAAYRRIVILDVIHDCTPVGAPFRNSEGLHARSLSFPESVNVFPVP